MTDNHNNIDRGLANALRSLMFATCVCIAPAHLALSGENAPSPMLDVFPPSVVEVPVARQGKTFISSVYTKSGTLWAAGLDERWVFNLEMKHQQDVVNSFALRIGKGGQVYSLRGPFGESVPPSWRGGGTASPWNDEVWQFVAVCTKYNLRNAGKDKNIPYRTNFFIHNSGAYIPGDAGIQNLYCPMLGSEISPDRRSYRTVNWGLVPQVRTIHRSPILYYCQTRDIGDGIIEMTWVVHNFSVREDIVFDHLNAPWGGTRVSALPLRYISTPEGELKNRQEMLTKTGIDVRKTGGWNISCQTESPDSPSLALVFGRDRHLETELKKMNAGEPYCQFQNSLYRDWRAGEGMYKTAWKDWRTRPENSFRNYDVAVVIPKLRLAPGKSIMYRSFLVVNRRDKAIELAKLLVDKVDYGLATFDAGRTPLIPLLLGGDATPRCQLYATPVDGAMPLFLIKNTATGQHVVTTDPYVFVPNEKVSVDVGLKKSDPRNDYFSNATGYAMDKANSDWQRLLGYGYTRKPATGTWTNLSTVVDAAMFPETDDYHLDLWVKPIN